MNSRQIKHTWCLVTAVGLLASSAASASPVLRVVSSCPDAGPIELRWSGASPQSEIAILWAGNANGRLVIPPLHVCAGTRTGLGVACAHAAHVGPSGTNGSGILRRYTGPNACRGFLQLIDLATCELSEVVPVQP